MYSDNIGHVCAYCFFSEQAKGLENHIYCRRRGEYRGIRSAVCGDYKYDIMKRPVRRRRGINKEKKYDFEI
ncbi:MAG: hypothetical protein J6N52_00885 [Clostridia bacterium]|nr:hypothetical protein [Clostridia bacterium]